MWGKGKEKEEDLTQWGGRGKRKDEETVHWSLWRADEDGKGVRLSWNQRGEKVANLHFTDQKTDEHKTKPSFWRR